MIYWISFGLVLKVKLKASLRQFYTVENRSREHFWLSDEPSEFGGNNEGPTPTELLLSSLASCKLITMRMYANRKNWDLQDASVSLKYIESSGKTIIEKSIDFVGDLNNEQIERLKLISSKCPVAKMLSESIEFKFI